MKGQGVKDRVVLPFPVDVLCCLVHNPAQDPSESFPAAGLSFPISHENTCALCSDPHRNARQRNRAFRDNWTSVGLCSQGPVSPLRASLACGIVGWRERKTPDGHGEGSNVVHEVFGDGILGVELLHFAFI